EAPGRHLERQVIVLRKVCNAEAVGHDLEEGGRGHRDALGAIPITDMEDGFVGAGDESRRVESAGSCRLPVDQQLAVGTAQFHPQSRCRYAAGHIVDVDRDAAGHQLKRTYSKLAGWLLMPRCGGAIQLANLPGSITAGPISEVT